MRPFDAILLFGAIYIAVALVIGASMLQAYARGQDIAYYTFFWPIAVPILLAKVLLVGLRDQLIGKKES